MTVRIRAHYDGKTIVPDEPVNWPAGTPVFVESATTATTSPAGIEPAPTLEERLAAFGRLSQYAVKVGLPLEATRRENMYEDR
jgi:hypothetical protein